MELPSAFPSGSSVLSSLTPASTAFRPDNQQTTKQKPLFEFQFSQDQVKPIDQFNRVQSSSNPAAQDVSPLPVPIVFRPQQSDVRRPAQESLPEQPAGGDTTVFQRVRPLTPPPIQPESPSVVEPSTTPRPAQLQVLGEEDPRQSRNNRIRRPLNNETPATSAEQQVPRRIPPVQEGNPNLEPVLVDDPPTLPPNRLRFRSSTTAAPVTTTPPADEPVTSRVRQPALRPRPTTPATNRLRPSVRITSSEIIRPQPEEEPSTTRSSVRFFGGRRPRPQEQEEVTTQRSVSRVRGSVRPPPPTEPTTTTTTTPVPVVLTNIVLEEPNPTVVDEVTDETLTDTEDEYYYDVVDEIDAANETESSVSSTTAAQELSVAEPVEPVDATAEPAVEQPVVENDHKPIEEPTTHQDAASPPAEDIIVEEVFPGEEAAAGEEAPKAVPNNRPAKFKLFNLGRRNSSSVNLDNIVFVPNLGLGLDDLVLPVATPSTTATPSDRQSKAIDSRTDLLGKQQQVKESEPAKESLQPEPVEATENRNDELDLIQSGLFNKHLNNNFNLEANKNGNSSTTTTTAAPTTTTTAAATTSSRPRPTFERPRRPSDVLGIQRIETPTTVSPETPDVAEQPPPAVGTEAPATSTSTTTTTTEATTTMSLFDRLFGSKVVVEDVSAFLPPGFTPPKEEPEAPATEAAAAAPPSTSSEAPPQSSSEAPPPSPLDKILGPVKMDDVSGFLPPGFKLDEPPTEAPVGPPSPLDTILGPVKIDDVSALLPPGFKLDEPPVMETTTKGALDGIFDSANLDDLSGLLPPGFKNHLFTPSPSKTTPAAEPVESSTAAGPPAETTAKKGLVFPTRASPARTTTSEKPRVKPTQAAIEIKSGWPVR